MDLLHDADEGGRAEHHWRGALQHLDALDIVHVQRGDHRIEGAAPGHAIDDQQEGVELVQTPERGNGAGRTRVATRRRLDAWNERQG